MGITNNIVNKSNAIDITNGATIGTGLTVASGNMVISNGDINISNSASDTTSSILNAYKSRNDLAIQTGDFLYSMYVNGLDSDLSYYLSSSLNFYSYGTITTNRIGSKISFYTSDDSSSSYEKVAEISNLGLAYKNTFLSQSSLYLDADDIYVSCNDSSTGTILAGQNMQNKGDNSISLGNNAGVGGITGTYNIRIGVRANYYPPSPGSGHGNTLIGVCDVFPGDLWNASGANLPSGSSNIFLGSRGYGVASNNTIRIGRSGTGFAQFNKCHIAGIYGQTVGTTAGITIIDSDSKLGTLSASAGCMFMGGTKPAFSAATYPTSTTQGDILISSSADTVESLAKNTSSTRYLSNTGTSNNPAWAQVNLANGVTGVLPTANGGALAYTEVTDGSSPINMASNSGYIVNDSDDDVTFVLPESPSVGDVFGIVGYSSDGWSVSVYDNDTQDIIYNGTAYNTITSAARYNCVEIRYIASNTFAVSRYAGSPTGS